MIVFVCRIFSYPDSNHALTSVDVDADVSINIIRFLEEHMPLKKSGDDEKMEEQWAVDAVVLNLKLLEGVWHR